MKRHTSPFNCVSVIAFIASTLLSTSTFAHDKSSALGESMEEIDSEVRAITDQVRAGAITPDTISKANHLQTLLLDASKETPPLIANLSPAEQALKKLEFQEGVLQAALLSIQLERALRTSDVSAASSALQSLNRAKREGHSKFKE